jgi:lipoprotein-releasing system permease protein
MFELKVALKYLIPKKKQLSVSIISTISVFVIALVVWLILLFFSVKNGLERVWVDKLIALTAPVRVTPTDAYYHSYYYLSDSISSKSNYNTKSIGEKFTSNTTDPYDLNHDEEIPSSWNESDKNPDGSVKDLVKLAYKAINGLPGVTAKDFEMTFSNLRLRLVRDTGDFHNEDVSQTFLNQGTYLGSFDSGSIHQTLLPFSSADLSNVIEMSSITSFDEVKHEDTKVKEDFKGLRSRLKKLFNQVTISKLRTPTTGWRLPKSILPQDTPLKAIVITKGEQVSFVMVPQNVNEIKERLRLLTDQGYKVEVGTVNIHDGVVGLTMDDSSKGIKNLKLPLFLPSNTTMLSRIETGSLDSAMRPGDVKYTVTFNLQGNNISGIVKMEGLQPDVIAYHDQDEHPFWVHTSSDGQVVLPHDEVLGQGILLPKNFREAGVLLGDRGHITYISPTTSSVQEQRIPVYVAGFYDHGIMPIGGKFILVNPEIVSLLRSTYDQADTMGAGINVKFDNLERADDVKKALITAFKDAGIDKYWKVETYKEYEFTKDLIQQLASEKNLFSLISMVIILVACSNIVSMLIILVNDKKVEIGILRAMGASSTSIACIFGLCGIIMGLVGSLIGIALALLTLFNLQAIIDFIGRVQGFQVFNSMFYGDALPNQLNTEALGFVLVVTVLISLISGVVPAVKASLMRPSAILRSE